MKAIIRFILIRYLEGTGPGREEKNPPYHNKNHAFFINQSTLLQQLGQSSTSTAWSPTELPCHHSSSTAACRSPSSISSCCSMETAPRPGLQSFCRGPCQTQLLLPKPSNFWRKRLQKHFDTAFANITNEALARFSSQAAAALPEELSAASAQLSVIVPTWDGVVPRPQRASSGETAALAIPWDWSVDKSSSLVQKWWKSV